MSYIQFSITIMIFMIVIFIRYQQENRSKHDVTRYDHLSSRDDYDTFKISD